MLHATAKRNNIKSFFQVSTKKTRNFIQTLQKISQRSRAAFTAHVLVSTSGASNDTRRNFTTALARSGRGTAGAKSRSPGQLIAPINVVRASTARDYRGWRPFLLVADLVRRRGVRRRRRGVRES